MYSQLHAMHRCSCHRGCPPEAHGVWQGSAGPAADHIMQGLQCAAQGSHLQPDLQALQLLLQLLDGVL